MLSFLVQPQMAAVVRAGQRPKPALGPGLHHHYCAPGSVGAGNWSQKPVLGVEPRPSNGNHGPLKCKATHSPPDALMRCLQRGQTEAQAGDRLARGHSLWFPSYTGNLGQRRRSEWPVAGRKQVRPGGSSPGLGPVPWLSPSLLTPEMRAADCRGSHGHSEPLARS